MTRSAAGGRPPRHLGTDSRDIALLVQRHRPALIRYFSRHLPSTEDAEDMAQETLVRLSRQPAAIVADLDNVEAYLLRIASNLLRDRFRRDRSRKSGDHVSIEMVMPALQSDGPCCERIYEDKRRLQEFLRVLDELPPRCRQVFLLQRYEGMTYSAIAKQLGISVSAVEKNMMRALLHLTARLAGS